MGMVRITLGSSVIASAAEEALGEGPFGVAEGDVVGGGEEAVGPGVEVASDAGVGFQDGAAAALGTTDGGANERSLGSGVASKELHDTDRTDRTTRADRRIASL